jgi:hypothetical protein
VGPRSGLIQGTVFVISLEALKRTKKYVRKFGVAAEIRIGDRKQVISVAA